MVTAFARVEGRPVGVVANNPNHLAGAIDSDGADKAARFLQLCDAFDIPIVTLVDTPGMMVGPEVEETALVRHCSPAVRHRGQHHGAAGQRGAAQVLRARRAGDDGRQHQGAGGMRRVADRRVRRHGAGGCRAVGLSPTSSTRSRIPTSASRTSRSGSSRCTTHGKALNAASHFEIDDVIDPADTRRWIATILASSPAPPRRHGKKRPNIDTW